jgi:Domain of unknown function (DUF4258)
MPPKWTQHSLDRLAERGITKEDVEWALNHPTGSKLPGQIGSTWVFGFTQGGRILKVCVATDDPTRVITAVWP